jgi:hypothetical membrane protein
VTSESSEWLARLSLAGPIAAALFSVSLIGVAALRTDGYSHAVNSVSGLGASGAPMALVFNVFGLIPPGMCIIVLSYALTQRKPKNRNR